MHLLSSRERGEGGNIYSEYLALVNRRGKRRVERVDSLHKEYITRGQTHALAGCLTLSCHEIETRQFHFLSVKKGIELLAKEIYIHPVERLEIVLSILVARSFLPVHKVVVQFYHLGIEAEHPALLGNAQRRGCLPARRGSGHHHNTLAVLAPEYFIGNLGVFALLPRLAEIDQRHCASCFEDLVQLLNGVNSDGRAPVGIFLPCGFNFCHNQKI